MAGLELLVLMLTGFGSIVILASHFVGEKFRNKTSTAVLILVLLALTVMFLRARNPAGLIGLTSALIGVASAVASTKLVKERDKKPFHDALLLILVASSFLVAQSNDLVRLFIYWETMSISITVLTAFHWEKESIEASLKYIMMCGAGSLIALAGIALALIETGNASMQLSGASLLAKALMVVGFGVEAAVFPLHFWLPDVHMAAPSTVSAILSGISIETAAYVISRIAFTDPALRYVLMISALFGMFVGNLSAYMQDDIKRLLAYSSVANVSYIILGLNSASSMARTYSMLHIFAHGMLKAALFILAGLFLAVWGTRSLKELSGKLSGTFFLKFTVVAASMGLTGIPPFLTFWSEAFTLMGISVTGSFGLAAAVLLAAAILLSFGYYFKLFYRLVVGSGEEKPKLDADAWCAVAAAGLLLLSCIIFGLYPGSLIRYFNL